MAHGHVRDGSVPLLESNCSNTRSRAAGRSGSYRNTVPTPADWARAPSARSPAARHMTN